MARTTSNVCGSDDAACDKQKASMYKQQNITMGAKYRGGMAMLFDWNARVLDLASN